MSSANQPEATAHPAPDDVVAAAGGDPRAAVHALLTENAELSLALAATSSGFARGWFKVRERERQKSEILGSE